MNNSVVLDWLLEEREPPVRYFTLRDVLDCTDNDSVLRSAQRQISRSNIVAKILLHQKPEGNWEDVDSPYLPKFKASYWQVMLLGLLGMDRKDERVRRACTHIFRFQNAEGGFSSNTERTARREYAWKIRRGMKIPSKKAWFERHLYEGQLSCLTGNMVAALLRLGYGDDRCVLRAIEWLIKIQNKDGGWLCPYWSAHARDEHGCFYGTIGPLTAFSELPTHKRNPAIQVAIEHGAEFLLMHWLFKADHHGYSVIRDSWLKFSFPPFYRYNILHGLDVLTSLGYTQDRRMSDAIEILLMKQSQNGTWILESAPAGRMHTNLGVVGKPSKWLTMTALRIFKRISHA